MTDNLHALLLVSRTNLAEDSSKRKQREKKYSEKGSRRFLRNVYTYENCALLGHYTESSGPLGITYRPHLQGSRGPIGYPETSVRNYHYSLRNSSGERRSRLLRGGSLYPCTVHSTNEQCRRQ